MEFFQKTFEHHNVKINYYLIGKGEPLLFLHGVGVRALTYKGVIESLAKHYTVIAPDLPGFGDSSTPKSIWDFRDYAQILIELLDHLNLNDITVVGHSFGGGVSLRLATKSKLISRLVLIDSAGITMKGSVQNYLYRLFILKSFNDLKDLRHIPIFLTIAKDFLMSFLKHLKDMPKIFQIVYNCKITQYPRPQIEIPILILWGKEDELIPREVVTELKGILPHAQVVEIEGNHDWSLFDPHLLYDQILNQK